MTSTGTTSRVPPTATPGYWVITRCLPTRADTGEVLHALVRKGSANTARGAQRFVRETIGRVRRAGATGKLTLRADSGFWSHKVITACLDRDVGFSITVRAQKHVVARIDTIDEAWVDIDYTDRGATQVAEISLGQPRLIVRRTKITDDPKVLAPPLEWRHHAFITNRVGDRSPSMPTTVRMPSRSW